MITYAIGNVPSRGSQKYPLRRHIVSCSGVQLTARKMKISQSSLYGQKGAIVYMKDRIKLC